MSFDLQLTGRRALVTGGTRGIGAAVVESLVDAGANVITTARSMPTKLRAGVRCIEAGCNAAIEKAGTASARFRSRWNQRSDLNPARSSAAKSSGCSHAAKCPPLSAAWK